MSDYRAVLDHIDFLNERIAALEAELAEAKGLLLEWMRERWTDEATKRIAALEAEITALRKVFYFYEATGEVPTMVLKEARAITPTQENQP